MGNDKVVCQTDAVAAAKSAGLRYIDNFNKGYFRKKKGRSFIYTDHQEHEVRDPELLERFRKLVIPPAYEEVWISPSKNTHLQFTGIDARGRKQYRYHAEWNKIRNENKFCRMLAFAQALPKLRKQVDADLSGKQLNRTKVMALVVRLLELTHIRVGNDAYSKLYGSFGLTTLKDRHVKFSGADVNFSFKGKKGVPHQIKLQSRKLRNLIKKCQEIPGKELFQYYDEEGQHHAVDSGDVNTYLKEITGQDFTAKDFRTWAGSVEAICALKTLGQFEKAAQGKKNVVAAIDQVAKKLGNTRTVCKKYYVHPAVLSAYEDRQLHLYKTNSRSNQSLTTEEKLLVKVLESNV